MTLSIGEQLQKARQVQHLSLEQVAQRTRIKLHYLQALEKNDFAVLPSKVQQRGFLRSYAELLNLVPESLLAQLEGGDSGLPVPAAGKSDPAGDRADGEADAQPVTDLEANAGIEAELTGSQKILKDLGVQLRQQREALGLTLEDVEQSTFLRLHYLKALENGRLQDLPSPVQGRGMLNNYAEFLGLEPEPVLLQYAEGLQSDLKSRQEAQRQTDQTVEGKRGRPSGRARQLPAPLQRLFSSDLWVGAFVVVFLVGFVVWAGLRISQMQSVQVATPTAPSIAEVLALDTPTPSITPSLEPTEGLPEAGLQDGTAQATSTLALAEVEATETEIPTPDFEAAESGRIQLYLVARQRAWTRVIVDGAVELEGRVIPGSAYLFTADQRIELLSGNGAALQVFLNRQDPGPLGIFGQVVERVFTLEGMLTPTPAVPPTATPTPTPEQTQTPETTGTPRNITPSPTNAIP